jgi:hypothetical protein
MSKQNDSGMLPVELVKKINRWNFDKSVLKMQELMLQWGKITAQVTRELYIAKEFLTNQKGQSRNPDAPNFIKYTWDAYCGAIGIDRQTADFWLKKYIPRELSPNGKDTLLLRAPVKVEPTTAELALMESRINEAIRTGEQPDDFTKEENAELKRRLESAKFQRFQKLAEELNVPVVSKTKVDYFTETLRRTKDFASFKLPDRDQIMAQATMFEHIEAYLKTYTDIEVKTRAAFNLAMKTKNLVNEIAETNFKINEAETSKDAEHDS